MKQKFWYRALQSYVPKKFWNEMHDLAAALLSSKVWSNLV